MFKEIEEDRRFGIGLGRVRLNTENVNYVTCDGMLSSECHVCPRQCETKSYE